MEEIRSAYKILVKNPEGKRPFGRPRRRWKGVEWIHFVQDRDQ
jgi:hypothetical protein